MARNIRTTFLSVVGFIVFFGTLYHHLSPVSISDEPLPSSPLPLNPKPTHPNHVIFELPPVHTNPPSSISADTAFSTPSSVSGFPGQSPSSTSISTVAILLTDWEVLVVVSQETPLPPPETAPADGYICLFDNGQTAPAVPSVTLSEDRTTFTCVMPERYRKRWPYHQPVLRRATELSPKMTSPAPPILMWNFIVYDTLTTEDDLILFVKGLNKRQDINRDPHELVCVFGDGDDLTNAVRTPVTTSLQEVFRCELPKNLMDDGGKPVKVTLEVQFPPNKRGPVPSVAYYTPLSQSGEIATHTPKSQICSCTMVYNVAKYLKEWVIYHSKIGVDKFMLYDNGSDDDLQRVVGELVKDGYDVNTLSWIWPKTQEGGFSHCAITSNDSCTWMMYVDVDEFVYSPSWTNSSSPSKSMLKSLLPQPPSNNSTQSPVGQVMINCHEFGPSNQKTHPVEGVTQGYNCRKRGENRHKSIVLLGAVDNSLLNVIHHFKLKPGYKVKKWGYKDALVNHYKYQAWSEFKLKFRRRVSAYVVDWTAKLNPNSQDRTPGLGYTADEPISWSQKFCEVYDNELRELARRWFRLESPIGIRMAWER